MNKKIIKIREMMAKTSAIMSNCYDKKNFVSKGCGYLYYALFTKKANFKANIFFSDPNIG